MNSKKIDRIIIKFIEDRSSLEENKLLKEWLQEEKNRLYFEQFVEVNYFLQRKKSFYSKTSLEKMMRQIAPVKRIAIRSYFKYAAVLVLFLGTGYFITQFATQEIPVEENTLVEVKEVTLELDSGKTIVLENSENQDILDAEGKLITVQKGNQLNYQTKIAKVNETLVYNKLTVPCGKTFQLALSDGTKVDVNAGTTLRYPVKFLKGQKRLVFVDGEAHFDVAKDKKHAFIVNANEVNIRVTGTQFNISNYPEDDAVNTVLVEGSVSVYEKGKEFTEENAIKVVPGQLATWSRSTQKTKISQVDTSLYTGWINGVLVFKHMKFSDMLVKLERRYDVKIKNNNRSLAEQVFTARFENATIEHVLETLNKGYGIEYTLSEKDIEIN